MRITVRSIGPLARALGGNRVAIDLPSDASARDLLARLVTDRPDAASFLGDGARGSARVLRGGRALESGDALRDDDSVDLVVAVGGG